MWLAWCIHHVVVVEDIQQPLMDGKYRDCDILGKECCSCVDYGMIQETVCCNCGDYDSLSVGNEAVDNTVDCGSWGSKHFDLAEDTVVGMVNLVQNSVDNCLKPVGSCCTC